MKRVVARIAILAGVVLVVAMTTSATWIGNFLAKSVPSYTAQDGIYLVLNDSPQVGDSYLDLETWLRSSIERDSTRGEPGAKLDINLAFSRVSGSDISYVAYVVATGAAADILLACRADTNYIDVEPISTEAVNTVLPSDWQFWFGTDRAATRALRITGRIPKDLGLGFGEPPTPEVAVGASCVPNLGRLWFSNSGDYYMSSPRLSVALMTTGSAQQGYVNKLLRPALLSATPAQIPFCSRVDYLSTRGSTLESESPPGHMDYAGGGISGFGDLESAQRFTSSNVWNRCDVAHGAIDKSSYSYVVKGSLVDIEVSDNQEKSRAQQGLFLGGIFAGLTVALMIEILNNLLELVTRTKGGKLVVLSRVSGTLARLPMRIYRSLFPRPKKSPEYEQLTLF